MQSGTIIPLWFSFHSLKNAENVEEAYYVKLHQSTGDILNSVEVHDPVDNLQIHLL